MNPNTRQPFCRECQNTGGVCQIDTNKNNKLGYLHLQIGGFLIKALVDTGASVSVMGQSLFSKIAACDPQAILTTKPPKNHTTVTLADGKTVPIILTARLEFHIFDETIDETFHILQDTHTTILGWPFFANNDLTIDCKRRLLIRENCTFQINAVLDSDTKDTQPRTTLDLCLTHTITIPPGRQDYPYCKIDFQPDKYKNVTGVVEPPQHHKNTEVAGEQAVGHTLVTLDNQGGCHVMFSNLLNEPRTFTKGLMIAQFTIMNSQDYQNISPVHPIAAAYITQAAPYITVNKADFQQITQASQQPKESALIDQLTQEVQELTQKYNDTTTPPEHTIEHDIIDYRPLEGATNEIWLATPENTTEPEKLDHFNKRVYNLILDCKEKEALDPTKSPEMRKEFLGLFEWEGTQFNKEQQKEIEHLLVKYHGIFARHRFDIGGNNEFKVKLTPTHNDPVYKKSPPTPVHIKEDLKVELALLQYYGILRTLPYSKYSSPIFAQRKPNGKMRILVDLRRINHILRHDYDENNFPIPSMEEANQHMANKTYFSKLDCSQAYHVVQMADERSVQLLAFNFESRTFAYQRLAQGLNRSATAFSSFMRKYLEKDIAADRCAAFMDDVCTATKTFFQHVEALDHVFASLKRSGLRLTVKKCEFGVPEIKYLGWTISKAGQGVQKDKIEKQIANMRMPRSLKQIQKLRIHELFQKLHPKTSRKTPTFLSSSPKR